MRSRWRDSIFHRLILLVFVASLVPVALLVGGSWYLNGQVRQQMEREADEALNFAINLEQTLIDGQLTRMRERAVAIARHPETVAALAKGWGLAPVLDGFQQALPGADLVTVVSPTALVEGRAGSRTTGDALAYGGLVRLVLDSMAPASSVVVITKDELAGEPAAVQAQVRVPILSTNGSNDSRVGQVMEDALALVGAAPVFGEDGQLLGAVLVSDILNNDYSIVTEVTNRSPEGLPINATIALDGVRVTTTVPALGGGKRAVGTLYSDIVMEHLREGKEYRGRAIVGGWQWQRTIYLPLRDPSGRVVAGPYVGIPEASFADLVRSTAISTAAMAVGALLSLVIAVTLAYRLALVAIARPLERLTRLLREGDLHVRVEADESVETRGLANALNGMTERIRLTMAEMARVSHGVKAISDDLAQGARDTAEHAEAALRVAASALSAAKWVSTSAQRAAGRMRELEVALARIDVGSEEQARALRHASQIVAQVTGAVHEAREGLHAVMSATRDAVAAAQQGRHNALRTLSALELIRGEAQGVADIGSLGSGESPEWALRIERLMADLEEGQQAVNDCDSALRQVAQATEEATSQLWAMAALQNESGARAGAVSQQLTDLSAVADETAGTIRSMSDVSREAIGEVESVAKLIDSGLALMQRAETHLTNIAEANRRLQALSERIWALAGELDQAASRFSQP